MLGDQEEDWNQLIGLPHLRLKKERDKDGERTTKKKSTKEG